MCKRHIEKMYKKQSANFFFGNIYKLVKFLIIIIMIILRCNIGNKFIMEIFYIKLSVWILKADIAMMIIHVHQWPI